MDAPSRQLHVYASLAVQTHKRRKEKKRLAVCLECQSQGWRMRLPNYLKAEMKDCWKNQQDLMQLAWREHTLFPLFLP